MLERLNLLIVVRVFNVIVASLGFKIEYKEAGLAGRALDDLVCRFAAFTP